MIGIYKITSPNSKIYIGKSKDIYNRFKTYKALRCKNQPRLYNSFVKHGVENHCFEVLEECDSNLLNEKEAKFIQVYKSYMINGLNCMGGMTSKGVLCSHSQETRDKISSIKRGKPSKLKGIKVGKRVIPNIRTAVTNLIIDMETGIYYESISECARANNIIRITLYHKLKRNTNKMNKPVRFILL